MIKTCDICASYGIASRAKVDTKTKAGPWAYLCAAHNISHGCGIPELTNDLSKLPND